MSPASRFPEVLQRQRNAYTEGVMASSLARRLEFASEDRRQFHGAFLLGVRDWARGARLSFEATEAGLHAEVVDG